MIDPVVTAELRWQREQDQMAVEDDDRACDMLPIPAVCGTCGSEGVDVCCGNDQDSDNPQTADCVECCEQECCLPIPPDLHWRLRVIIADHRSLCC
jgi:hypothetical protein